MPANRRRWLVTDFPPRRFTIVCLLGIPFRRGAWFAQKDRAIFQCPWKRFLEMP